MYRMDHLQATVREAGSADIPAMVELLGELFALEEDFQPDSDRQFRGLEALLADSSTGRAWVAVVDGQVAGMCTLQVLVSTAEGGRVGLVEDVVVAKAYRGRGVGRKLVEALGRWSARHGLLRLQLLADRDNAGALGFYERLGWHRTRLTCLRKGRPGR